MIEEGRSRLPRHSTPMTLRNKFNRRAFLNGCSATMAGAAGIASAELLRVPGKAGEDDPVVRPW